MRRWLALAACCACVASCGGGLSEAEARQVVEEMTDDVVMEAPEGSVAVETVPDACGGGSVAPAVERTFAGGPTSKDAESSYRERLRETGWREIRAVPAGGVGATQENRTVLVRSLPGGQWSVHMQHGSTVADCSR